MKEENTVSQDAMRRLAMAIRVVHAVAVDRKMSTRAAMTLLATRC